MEGLANVLEKVGFINLFAYLRFNDLLRLRRLCQWSKPLAEDYLRLKATTKRCIEVSLDPKEPNNLYAFLDLGFTFGLCNISIKNESNGNQIWDMEENLSFLKLYGQKISQLKLGYLEIPMSSEALAFFESLSKLEHLEIDYLCLNISGKELELPSTFRKLKKLCVGQCSWNIGMEQGISYKRQVFGRFLEWCQPRLESFTHVNYFGALENPPAEIFEPVRTTLIEVPSPVLKNYDLRGVYNNARDQVEMAMDFYRLLTACYQNNVKLSNVTELLIYRLDHNLLNRNEMLSEVIISLSLVGVDCFYLELPHLDTIEICSSELCDFPQEEFARKAWPNLKCLRFNVDSNKLIQGSPINQLLDYFFVGIRREKMEQLELTILQSEDEVLPFPRAVDIGDSCPNLKYLHLTGWLESNLAICKLWEMLPQLEVLIFESCYELGIEAFIGEDREEPSFLKLKNLQKLGFIKLDRMPKITDELFLLVLRHMPLKELHLVASKDDDNPRHVQHITAAGVKSLLAGVFAESIERFPLQGLLKLKDVSDEELSALEKEFRSARML